MRGGHWTEERIALLKELWAKGETAPAIGARLGGLSRSAVLGKIFRLRLGGPNGKSPSAAQKSAARNKQPRETRAPNTRHKADAAPAAASANKNPPQWRRRGVHQRNAAENRRAATLARGKTLLELTNYCCRWPIGRPGTARFFFCGAESADLERGMPYCAHHARRAYRSEAAIAVETKPVVARAA